MPRFRTFCLLVCLLLLIQGCVSAPPAPTATPTIDPATPRAATAAAQTESAEATQAAEIIQSTADALFTQSAQETADAAMYGTETAVAEATAAQLAIQGTGTASVRQTQAADIAATSTANAQAVYTMIDGFVAEGYLSTNQGSYFRIDDFSTSLAMINYYSWKQLPYFAQDFVIDTDFSWESASESAQWFTSGCGFVFRLDSNDRHYMTFLGLDGYVYVISNVNNNVTQVTRGYYGELERMEGSAHFTLIVEGRLLTILVNDKEVINNSVAALDGDGIGMTMVSGINTGFGIRCKMTDTLLWEVFD